MATTIWSVELEREISLTNFKFGIAHITIPASDPTLLGKIDSMKVCFLHKFHSEVCISETVAENV